MAELRTRFIGRTDGSPCEDELSNRGKGWYGPFASKADFNEGIVRVLRGCSPGVFVEMVADMVRALRGHEIVLSHGDLAPRNTIVQGPKVVGIVDWEMAGFWPEY